MLPSVLWYLTRFNRKERFFVVGEALGNRSFCISEQFRQRLNSVFHLEVPESAFAAVDYHLDWLFASLFLASHRTKLGVYPRDNNVITANQEDIDFLVAYQDKDACRIIVIEAKGVTGFTNHQMGSKAKRLKHIFDDEGNRWPSVIPYFGILSPKKPQQLDTKDWPSWMQPDGGIPWMPLEIPQERLRITRCNSDGKAAKDGAYWKVV